MYPMLHSDWGRVWVDIGICRGHKQHGQDIPEEFVDRVLSDCQRLWTSYLFAMRLLKDVATGLQGNVSTEPNAVLTKHLSLAQKVIDFTKEWDECSSS